MKIDSTQTLNNLIKERAQFIDSFNQFENLDLREKSDKMLEINAESIIDLISDYRDSFCIEEILESLTELGLCPSLLYDDNGNWCVIQDGIQDLDPVTIINFQIIDIKVWKPTIRKALYYFLDDLKGDV